MEWRGMDCAGSRRPDPFGASVVERQRTEIFAYQKDDKAPNGAAILWL
jgi:hypothetical protein